MRRAVVSLVALVAASVPAALATPRASRWLVRPLPVPECDLMVVLEGGAEERLSTAVDLMSGGACRKILFTGSGPGERIEMVRALLAEIDPAARVPAPAVSRDTFGDAVVALRAALEGGYRSILVVTSPYHTRRAAWAFRRVFEGSGIRVGVYPSGTFYMDYDRWWSGRHGRGAVLGEYAKLLLYGFASEAFVRAGTAAGRA